MTHLGCVSFFVHLELKLYLKGLGVGDLRPKYFACGLRNTTGFLLWWLCSLKSFPFFFLFLECIKKRVEHRLGDQYWRPTFVCAARASVANMVILNLSALATKNTLLTTISKEMVLMAKKKKKKKPPKYEQIRTLGFTLGLPRHIEWDAIA